MAGHGFPVPGFSRKKVDWAGDVLRNWREVGTQNDDLGAAIDILRNWRSSHLYPLNTFQSTLRTRVKKGYESPRVALRLKRAATIVNKLIENPGMQLSRMADIGGLRAILASVPDVRMLEHTYRSCRRLTWRHELQDGSKDYITTPKSDGYRGVHLIYKYINDGAPQYNSLRLELQIRTQMQHAWATAVEAYGSTISLNIKGGKGSQDLRKYFLCASAIIAHQEETPLPPGFQGKSVPDIYREFAALENRLTVLRRMRSIAIVGSDIELHGSGSAWHVVVLNTTDRSVYVRSFPRDELSMAEVDLAKYEQRKTEGAPIDAILVSAGKIHDLKRAYPNFFLDTKPFQTHMQHAYDVGSSI